MTTNLSSGAAVANPGTSSLKARQQAMWASGDFAVIGTTLQIVGELLCEGVDLRAGERVLDVAAGNGNATLAAARRFARVTSTDYVPQLLERGRRRADAEALDVTFEVADAEALPYPAAGFDVVLSSFGVMFAPEHAQAAGELMRVCRPGGRIGLALRGACSQRRKRHQMARCVVQNLHWQRLGFGRAGGFGLSVIEAHRRLGQRIESAAPAPRSLRPVGGQ